MYLLALDTDLLAESVVKNNLDHAAEGVVSHFYL